MTTINEIRQTVARRERARAQRSIPRKPSPRNLEIYHRVTINCEPQHTLAAEYRLHPTRISQILRAVRAYTLARRASEGKAASITDNAGSSSIDSPSPTPHPPTPSSPSSFSIQPSSFPSRLTTLIARQEHLATLLTREYNRHAPPPSDSSDPDSSAPSALPLQCLKASQRNLIELRRLYTLEDALLNPRPQPAQQASAATTSEFSIQNSALQPAPDPAKEFRNLQNALFILRQEAEDQGLVPKSPDVYWIVENLLNSFLGRTRTDSGGYRPLTDSYRQFLQAFLTSPSKFSTHSPETAELVTTYLQKDEASPTPSFNPQPQAQDPVGCVQRSADTRANAAAIPDPTPNSLFPTPSPNSSLSIQPSEFPSSLNMSARPSNESPAITPDSTTTSAADPIKRNAPKKSPPPPPKPSSFPLRGPVISLIDPADYKALFDPWSREY